MVLWTDLIKKLFEGTMQKQFWAILIGVSVGLIGLFMITSDSDEGTNNISSSIEQVSQIQATDHVYIGEPKEVTVNDAGEASVADDTSKVTIVEYGDFGCPACFQAFPIIEELKAEYGSDLRFIFRHFPLSSIHPNATAAHRAAEAAGNQGKFFEMHDLLYERQQFWARQTSGLNVSAAIDVFKSYAEELELDMDQYNTDVESLEVFEVIDAQSDGGASLGITGTPTFFINDERIETPRNTEQFRELIDAAIAAADGEAGESTEDSADDTSEDTSDKEEAAESN